MLDSRAEAFQNGGSVTEATETEAAQSLVGTVLATLPTLVIFFLLQRQFVEGLLGSVK